MRKGMTFSLLAVTLLSAATIPYTPSAIAQDTICDGILAPETYQNIIVPTGSMCFLNPGVIVTGNVEVQSGAIFVAFETTIHGNVESDAAASIFFMKATIGGNVEISRSAGGVTFLRSAVLGNVEIEEQTYGSINIDFSTINGNFELEKNKMVGRSGLFSNMIDGNVEIREQDSEYLTIFENTIAGNVELDKNTTVAFPFGDNTVGGNLECKGNTPSPDAFGSPNNVSGNKEQQCAAL